MDYKLRTLTHGHYHQGFPELFPQTPVSGYSWPHRTQVADNVVSPSCFRSSLPSCPFSWRPFCHSYRPSVVFESCNMSRPSLYSLLDNVDYVIYTCLSLDPGITFGVAFTFIFIYFYLFFIPRKVQLNIHINWILFRYTNKKNHSLSWAGQIQPSDESVSSAPSRPVVPTHDGAASISRPGRTRRHRGEHQLEQYPTIHHHPEGFARVDAPVEERPVSAAVGRQPLQEQRKVTLHVNVRYTPGRGDGSRERRDCGRF